MEQEIEQLEQELRHLGHDIERASAAQDMARLHRLSQDFQHVQNTLAARMAEWEEQMRLVQQCAGTQELAPSSPQDAS